MFEGIFENAVVAGVPLLLFVIGIVQYIKSFGFTGNAIKILSMVIGILLGIGYKLSTQPPVSFADWFAIVIFGIALGLTASGIYDAAKK